MKKIFVIFLAMIFISPVLATTMCVRTGAYVVTLLRSRDGLSYTTDGSGGWTVNFDYDTSSLYTSVVTGFAACNEISGTFATADGTLSTSVSDTGLNCWCMMKTPLVSDWVFLNTYSSDADCASGCATSCANNIKTSTAFRTGVYGAVW